MIVVITGTRHSFGNPECFWEAAQTGHASIKENHREGLVCDYFLRTIPHLGQVKIAEKRFQVARLDSIIGCSLAETNRITVEIRVLATQRL